MGTKTATATLAYEVGYTAADAEVIATTYDQKNTKSESKTEFTSGTGDAQINRIYRAQLTISPASGAYDLDLSTVRDPFGDLCNFTDIKAIYLRVSNEDDTESRMIIGGAGTNAWTGPFNGNTTYKFGPTNAFQAQCQNNGWAVSASSKLLRITHDGFSSGNLLVDIIVLGVGS